MIWRSAALLALGACSAAEPAPALPATSSTTTSTAARSVSPRPAASTPATLAPRRASPAHPGKRLLRLADEARIDAAVEAAIRRGEVPGAVVAVTRQDRTVFLRAYGDRSRVPQREAMRSNTIFDLASLTKPIATALALGVLVDRGKLQLTDPASTHLGELRGSRYESVTVEQLLAHRSGLPAANPLSHYEAGRAAAIGRIARMTPRHPPGERMLYSDLGYILLGELVARVAGESLDAFVMREVLVPLGMKDTRFGSADAARTAPTEPRDGRMLRGVVHDPRAHALAGVAGHAGLFGTASDVASAARLWMSGGPVVRSSTMTALRNVALRRAAGGVGHTGFTGTSFWLEPRGESAVVALTSRLHPKGKGNAVPLRRALRDVLRSERPPGKVRLGVDRLDRVAARLAGKRVAVLTHTPARTSSGQRSVDAIATLPGVKLAAIFTPEHGLSARAEGAVKGTRDATTGAIVHSLYGARRKPTTTQLAAVDVVVVDLVDIGARFYTYATTLGHMLEAAAAAKRPVIVLDRPNPIGGAVEGPLLDPARRSFIAYHTIPVRHGMTLGELARLFNQERGIRAELEVVKVDGWRQAMRLPETGVRWIDPSPNMRSMTAALLYPGVGLLEATNVSVGRGTATPFEHVGAPWIDAKKWRGALGTTPGLRVRTTSFTPVRGPHKGRRCHGLAFRVRDPNAVEPVLFGLQLARALARTHPKAWRTKGLLRMVGNRAVVDAVTSGESVPALRKRIARDAAAFAPRRAAVKLYD